MIANVFYRKFRKSRALAPVLTATIGVDAGMTLAELLDEAAEHGIASGGNTWAGIFEIQTDEGIWSPGTPDGVLRRGKPVFRSWDDIEAAELAAESEAA